MIRNKQDLQFAKRLFFNLLELGSQFDCWVRGVSSSTVSDDEAIDQGVEIRLQKNGNFSHHSNVSEDVSMLLCFTLKCGIEVFTWTSNKSEVAFTGKNRERGTLTPIALSKNCFKTEEIHTTKRSHNNIKILQIVQPGHAYQYYPYCSTSCSFQLKNFHSIDFLNRISAFSQIYSYENCKTMQQARHAPLGQE